MPIERKPLFRPDVMHQHLVAFELPEYVVAMRPKLTHWADLIASGRADKLNEKELLPDFLTDFFVELLGYTRPADGGQRYTLSREKHVQVDGKYADAVLGDFNGYDRPILALEGKGTKDPLDRPWAGRKMSAVDQGYRYAINLPCDWIVITSMRQVRLYYKGADQLTYERFDAEALADNENLLRQFVFLLGAERAVPLVGRCHLYALLAESEKVGRELTKKFYVQYGDMRQGAFARLCQDNPQTPPKTVLSSTQKLLDRVLFCAFAEDRGLLPVDTIRKAYEHRDPYHPRPIYDNFRGLFQAINGGNAALGIHAYNGGLFAEDASLDGLQVSDGVCGYFRDLGDYDYRPPHQAAVATGKGTLIDVDILGHIFEQSITDLERLRNELDGVAEPKSRRKKEGAFYTPSFITRYIIEQALGGVLRDRFERLRQKQQEAARGTARSTLADPTVYALDKLKKPERTALVEFWEGWQDELAGIRLLDPACGSGAFLIQAFDQLYAEYQASNDRLKELGANRPLLDLDKRILQDNLYGVDLNDEAVEICRLSLWIKTAHRGKPLTSLDRTICIGNSIVADPAVDPKAFDWQGSFPEVFRDGGFDVVVANPPYVRQELLQPIKPYLETAYRTYHGMADLYVYFYELGLRLLKPGGRLSLIVTNKWMKASYGEPLRRFFGEQAWIESVVDFGHAKQIFEDVDVFPSILVARRPTDEPKPTTTRLCTIPREQLRIDDLSRQIEAEGVELSLGRLGTEAWQLEPDAVVRVCDRIRNGRVPLGAFADANPARGILTGLNEAFLIDTPTRNALVETDAACAEIIKPYVRGQDIDRWTSGWAGLWMIAIKSSGDYTWPWSNVAENAEDVFRRTYPSIYARFKSLEAALRKRQDQGRNWWELRSCAYWKDFERPKIVYQEIQFHPSYAFDRAGMFGNNKTFFVPSEDLYLLVVLNSPLMWWYNWRYLPHMKDEALSPVGFLMESLPIARPSDPVHEATVRGSQRLIEIRQTERTVAREILDWLRVEHRIEKPTTKLQSPMAMDSDGFVAEVKKLRGKKNPLSAAALRSLRDEYARTIEPARQLVAESAMLERQLSDLVNEAYGLTADEVNLLWDTAPPRMPIADPRGVGHC